METTRVHSFAAIGILCLGASLVAQEPIRNQCPQEANLGHVSVTYDKFTGEVRVNTHNSGRVPLSSFVIDLVPTTEWRFVVGEDPDGDNFYDGCAFGKGFFNLCRPDKLAVIDVSRFGAWPDAFSFGNIAEPGLDFEFLQSVLLISGAELTRYQFQSTTGFYGPCLFVVPEPSGVVLLGLGLWRPTRLRRCH